MNSFQRGYIKCCDFWQAGPLNLQLVAKLFKNFHYLPQFSIKILTALDGDAGDQEASL